MDKIDKLLIKISKLHKILRENPNMPTNKRWHIINKLKVIYTEYIDEIMNSNEVTFASFFTCIDLLNDNIAFLKENNPIAIKYN